MHYRYLNLKFAYVYPVTNVSDPVICDILGTFYYKEIQCRFVDLTNVARGYCALYAYHNWVYCYLKISQNRNYPSCGKSTSSVE